MEKTMLTRKDAFASGAIVVLATILAALLVAFVAARPSEAADPIVVVEPTEVGFGAVEVGQDSKTNTIYVRNNGDTTLNLGLDILGVSLADFELVGHSLGDVLTIAPGTSEPVQIKFSPSGPGESLATLNLTTLADPLNPVEVDLSGTGITQNPNQQPEAQANCDITGTPGRDVLTGTPQRDVICGLGGRDSINGRGANDIERGGSGNDRMIDKKGKDKLLGQGGRDRLNTRDHHRGDLLKGGARKDSAIKDKGDRARSI